MAYGHRLKIYKVNFAFKFCIIFRMVRARAHGRIIRCSVRTWTTTIRCTTTSPARRTKTDPCGADPSTRSSIASLISRYNFCIHWCCNDKTSKSTEPWSSGYVLKAMGSNPGALYWMDMTIFHIDLL